MDKIIIINKEGHHGEVVIAILSEIDRDLHRFGNVKFIDGLPNNIKKLIEKCHKKDLLKIIGKHMIETIEKLHFDDFDEDDDFITRSGAQRIVQNEFNYIYNYSINGGNTKMSNDYEYVLKTYIKHIGNVEGYYFLDRHKLPPPVYNTLVHITKQISKEEEEKRINKQNLDRYNYDK